MGTIWEQLLANWFLLTMFTMFIGIILFAFRPSAKKQYEDLRSMPLRDDDILPEEKPEKNNG